MLLDVHVGVRAAAAVDFDAMAAAASSWHADVFRLWRPFADAQRAPRLVARPVGRATDDDDASVNFGGSSAGVCDRLWRRVGWGSDRGDDDEDEDGSHDGSDQDQCDQGNQPAVCLRRVQNVGNGIDPRGQGDGLDHRNVDVGAVGDQG